MLPIYARNGAFLTVELHDQFAPAVDSLLRIFIIEHGHIMRGQALVNVSNSNPISRETANRVLQEFMEPVQMINAGREFDYKIKSVSLFGSMLSGAERLGDVDLAIEMKPAIHGGQEFEKYCDLRCHTAQANGRRFTSVFDWAT